MKKLMFLFFLLWAVAGGVAAAGGSRKMSPLVREAFRSARRGAAKAPGVAGREMYLTAFVRTVGDGKRVLADNGCRELARFGDICIASIPIARLGNLAEASGVVRIEAGESCSLLMDTTAVVVGALPVYEGRGLPQAYTGKGVVMGVQDVGFDLTHPNFYDKPMGEYRIKRFWDQLSADTVGGNGMYVGSEYVSREDILGYAHSRDGLMESHGTHTLGIAAGSGYDKPYRGIAYESDICLVSNAITRDTVFISEADRYKYTSATDALGFKYIFDYAANQGKPCVVSFSEGSHQDFYGDDQLYYEVLQQLVGPGRIIVASAGNEGHYKTYFRKPAGVESDGTFILKLGKYAYLKMTADAPICMRMSVYSQQGEKSTVDITTGMITSAEDSTYTDTLEVFGRRYVVEAYAYPYCYDSDRLAYGLYVETTENFGYSQPFSLEVVGKDADVEVFRGVGDFYPNSRMNPSLSAGEHTHSVYSPGSAPAVICAGATSYRTGLLDSEGHWTGYDWGKDGELAGYSSVGPTVDGRIKPDVVAPGSNVVSSFSSYYLEANKDDEGGYIAYSDHNGRTYPWIGELGTSMSAPVVGGAIALWLEAVPTLTPQDIKDVFSRTCTRKDMSEEYPNNRYGYGEIDIYKGLLDILGLTAIEGVSAERPGRADIRFAGGAIAVDFHTRPQNPFTISVYSVSGSLILRKELPPCQSSCTVDASSLPAGVYLVQLSGRDKGLSGSALIRKND